MNRLQKKCFIAAAGLHLLLGLILIVGPAFLSPTSNSVNVPLIDFIPVKTVDALLSGGGNPNGGTPPPPAPEPPAPAVIPPAPIPAQIPAPQPVKDVEIKPPLKDEVSLTPIAKPKPRLPEVSTTVVKRPADAKANLKARAEADAKTAAAAKAKADAIRAVAAIGSGLSAGTSIELKGPGGGGVPYANFLQAVKKAYTDAWIVPDGIDDDSATVAVSVTIARNGSVISSRILQRSGNAAVDQSIQMTLDRVKYAAPLPDDAKESERTVTIDFNVKAKLLG